MMKQTHCRDKKRIRRRRGLAAVEGMKTTFRAVLGRSSMTNFRTAGLRQATLELKDIYTWDAPDEMVADHLWVKLDSIHNREIIDNLISLDTENVKRIVFSGTVYNYSEPFGGRGFRRFSPRYSIGDIEVRETRPLLAQAAS